MNQIIEHRSKTAACAMVAALCVAALTAGDLNAAPAKKVFRAKAQKDPALLGRNLQKRRVFFENRRKAALRFAPKRKTRPASRTGKTALTREYKMHNKTSRKIKIPGTAILSAAVLLMGAGGALEAAPSPCESANS